MRNPRASPARPQRPAPDCRCADSPSESPPHRALLAETETYFFFGFVLAAGFAAAFVDFAGADFAVLAAALRFAAGFAFPVTTAFAAFLGAGFTSESICDFSLTATTARCQYSLSRPCGLPSCSQK